MSKLIQNVVSWRRIPSAGRGLSMLVLALAFAGVGSAAAQSGFGDMVYTVGTVTRDANGQDWAYILWQATQPGLTSNRVFAVYSKPGDVTSSSPYTRASIVTLQTDSRVIEPLLRRAANLGDDMNKLNQDLLQLFATLVPSGGLSRADQLSAVIRGSLANADYYQNLLLLARNHAGIDLALGFADAELIGPGKTTFEVRVYDPATDQDLAVIGRVTVEAGNPTVLPAPGPPVQVPNATPRGDLNLLFRWGTPDNLRRLGLLQFGYDLYRVPLAYAATQGWDATHPPPAFVLTNLIVAQPGLAHRVNMVPVTPPSLFTLPDAANVVPPTGDTNTYFIMDDDGRGKSAYINYGFTNGAQFYYYVAARDVLGRDGALSPGLLATVCDRMAPLPPTDVHVLNNYVYNPSTQLSNQALQIVWTQSTQTNDTVTNYWIYRWTNSLEMNLYSGNPSNNLIGIVPHVPGAVASSFRDDGPTSPTALGAYGQTFWYTVRAGDAGACGQNLSGAAGPAYGVLRQRVGPDSGTGFILINCTEPSVTYAGSSLLVITNGPDTNNYDFLLTCPRVDSRFEWAEFYGIATYTAPNGGSPVVVSNFIGRFYYSASTATAWWTPWRTNQQYRVQFQVSCRAALATGKLSPFVVTRVNPPDFGFYESVQFNATGVSFHVTAGDTNYPDCQLHDAGAGLGGLSGTNNIIVNFQPTARSAEYRLYRRVDDGPMSLLCQGAITNVGPLMTCFEDSPPVNGGTICFFLQLLDADGNPSAMTQLGCVDSYPTTTPPVPVLAKITPSGDQNAPGMALSWFCPPYGVERFEVRIAGLPTPPDTNNLELSSSLGSLSNSTPMTVTNLGVVSTLPFYTFITPRVGSAFGNNGADFSVPCNVELGKTYFVTVRALLKGNYPGAFSGTESFLWSPTNAVSAHVNWPALGFPGTSSSFGSPTASFLSPASPSPATTPSYTGVGVLLGSAAFSTAVTVDNSTGPAYVSASFSPDALVITNSSGQSLFPCALYRYQVANARFPVVSGDVIQVSPLMETIAYATNQTVIQGGTNPVSNLVWQGEINGTWDIATTPNWFRDGAFSVYHEGDAVLFDDTANGNTSVSLSVVVNPASISCNNSTRNYVIGGPGSIAGITGLQKNGSGALTLSSANTYSGATVVKGGVLIMNGALFNSAVTVQNGGTLEGNGFIARPVNVQAGGTLAPGTSIGTLIISNTLTLAGYAQMEINRTNVQTSDRVTAMSSVSYGGTLSVTNLGPPPQFGDVFTLFVAGSYGGGFSSYSLPTLSTGLVWNTSLLLSNGSITVAAGPVGSFQSQSSAPASPAAPTSQPNAAPLVGGGSSTVYATVIFDPFVTATTTADSTHRYLYLWLQDTQPQISGARYKYVLVRFKPNHEIDQLIPSSEVDVP